MKYKLIKEYPRSLKLNSEITNKKIENPNWYYLPNACLSIVANPENYPEFWQKVVEKDYEILSFKNIDNNLIYDKYQEIYKNNISIRQINYCLEFYKIHSVKRLSDGEIFTIGDIVKCEDCKGKITSLETYDNDIYLSGIDNKIPFGFTLCNALDCFEIPQKIKQSLFTTKDGVDIFENDLVTTICSKTLVIQYLWKVTEKELYQLKTRNIICFSTKEKAKEYILMNKPCLSINDITFPRIFDGEEELIKLVKSKIKQSV